MSLRRLLTQQATIRRRVDGPDDGYGNPQPVWEDAGVLPAFVQPLSGSEVESGADTQTTAYRGFLPPFSDVDGTARLVVDGVTYEVVGPPLRHRTPRGDHHVEVRLEVVE